MEDLDLARLETAASRLVERHEMLRAVFDEQGDQRVLSEVPWLDRVRQVQEELWGALDHRDVSAVWVLRELAR
ncbi:hypothetical protein, partial [Amycolatopsis sp. NPDC102389]|uniref:hypothetical protein n=1 Tax=Amycolatopsis sp. NPDC102389 TaxID=3363941 RepID=UPI00382DBE8D